MKSRPYNPPKRESDADFRALSRALAALGEPKQVAAFLRDLCTPAELEAMCDRWKVVPLLRAGEPYRGIHAGGYDAAIEAQNAAAFSP